MAILVIDAGTSGVRAAIVEADATISLEYYAEALPDTPAPGLVEFDAATYAALAIELANRVLAEAGPVDAVGISTQRASVIVWDRATGEPVAPAQSWQDLRTLGDCLVLQGSGLRFAPNQSATKIPNILNAVDPDRSRDLCVGTPETWLVWNLTQGAAHVTDLSNAAVTGLLSHGAAAAEWDQGVLDTLGIPASTLPRIVDCSGEIAPATALAGSPPICGLAGDQQASLIGQGCVQPGLAKVTFGTGAMLDLCVGPDRPTAEARAAAGTFPIVCWGRDGSVMWGIEALMLSAGTNVQWLRDDLGIIASAGESDEVAAQCDHTDGVMYVPAQLGLGTPYWDYGARGSLLGLTRGSGRPQIIRAVLEGIAHRGADLVEAAEADSGLAIGALRIDGGMSDNVVFTQALADITGRRVEVSPVRDATALGAAFLAGLAIGTWPDWNAIAATWRPTRIVEPRPDFDRAAARKQWASAIERARGWYADLSGLDF